MPRMRKSSACVDYVPALCTHRPSRSMPLDQFAQGDISNPDMPFVHDSPTSPFLRTLLVHNFIRDPTNITASTRIIPGPAAEVGPFAIRSTLFETRSALAR